MANFQIRYIAESVWGTTPASAMTNFRATSANLKAVNNTVVSEEMRSDGQITDLIRVGVSATATVGYELSYGTLDDFLAAAFRSTWTADTGFAGASSGTDLLEHGSATPSFTLESEFTDISRFLSITGARVGQITLSMAPGQIVRGTVDFVGKVAAIASATVGTGAATAATTTDVLDPTRMTGMEEGGSTTEMLGIDLTINHNLRPQQVLGNAGLRGVAYGRFNVSGSARFYFTDSTIITKAINTTSSTLDWVLNDAAGNALAFSIPKLKYTDVDAPNESGDGDNLLTLPFQALYDPTTGETLRIARTPA